MVEQLQIYRDASELIKRVFIIVKQFPRDYYYKLLQLKKIYCFEKRSKYGKI